MPDLRERQRDLARATILDACSELVVERKNFDFSVQEVADRAGVSLRTVYNHFGTRETLFDGLVARFDEQMTAAGGLSVDEVSDLDDLPRAVAVNFRVFEALGEVSRAMAQMASTAPAHERGRRARTERITAMTREGLSDLDPDHADRIGRLIRHVGSHASWAALREVYGMDADDAADVAGWAVRALIDQARSEPRPRPTSEASTAAAQVQPRRRRR